MRTNQVPLVVLAAALSACAIESETLNSERIAQRFGSYGLELLPAEPGLRRSNLYSTENDVSICRTYAIVRFADPSSNAISDEHASVLAGNSIGAIFKANGWQIIKETLFIGTIRVDSPGSEIGRLMHLEDSKDLAVHVYRLRLLKMDTTVDYATIIESHHPDYLAQADLESMYLTDDSETLDYENVNELTNLVLLPDRVTAP